MSFRSNTSYTALLATVRERAGELTSQTLSLRGRAAAGVVGGATLGVLAFGSAVGAVASTGPAGVPGSTSGGTVAGVAAAGAGKAGHGVVRPERLTGKPSKSPKSEKSEDSRQRGRSASVAGKAADVSVQKKAGSAESAASGAESKSASASKVLKLAEKQVGISEGKDGDTKFNDWFIDSGAAKITAKRDGGSVADYKGASWCDMFVSWLGAKAGVKGMGSDAYTVEHAEWFKKNDRWGKKAKPGAVVFFAWDGGGISGIEHVGMVVKDNGDGTIKTIEGNTDNAVKAKTREKSQVVGYGYPDYRG